MSKNKQNKEANARIKINRLLEAAGWRLQADDRHQANVVLEGQVKMSESIIEDSGVDYEKTAKGYMDFLLLDQDKRPLVVLEAKREEIDPLSSKEQARNYAKNVGARFIILSNGNLHYFWDTAGGHPETISRFPTLESITQYEKYTPNPQALAQAAIDENYIIQSQLPNYAADPEFGNEKTRADFLKKNNLKQLRPYQVEAIKALQSAAEQGRQRFLFEMATGTGKTLVSAAVIKLFLRSGNARRVLFLVDRLELEDQAQKAFVQYLGKDYQSVIYKDNRDSWAKASIVVSTIQTFLAGDRYRQEFSPTDFELVISDEAHRSIGGNSRAVFEYFVGWKLGLTATPKNYLKGLAHDEADSQREYERRVLLDTYQTFGCQPGEPTFSYDLLKGARDSYLIQPILVDARTEITAELLSDQGYAVRRTGDNGEQLDQVFNERHYEKQFFNEETNIAMAKAFLDNGLFDPVAREMGVPLFGKSIVFCVSQKHAARVTNILNRLAGENWPGLYTESDFAIQVTSQVQNAQQMTINFANNRLGGSVKNPPGYDSGRTRVAVTVGMMTTGYDCPDILNLALLRPVFSPADFVQIKGRGTRKFLFEYEEANGEKLALAKERFKFFDFFASCEYFEKEYPYDEKIKLPQIKKVLAGEAGADKAGFQGEFVDESGQPVFKGPVNLEAPDELQSVAETEIGAAGMRIDREGFRKALEEDVLGNETLQNLWANGDREEAEDFAKQHIFNKPKFFLNLDKVRRLFGVDRRIGVREFLQFAFGEKKEFEMKDDLLEKEWEKFIEINQPDQAHYWPVKNYFKAYVTDEAVRDIVRRNQPAELFSCDSFDFEDYKVLNGFRETVPQYIHDYAGHLLNLD